MLDDILATLPKENAMAVKSLECWPIFSRHSRVIIGDLVYVVLTEVLRRDIPDNRVIEYQSKLNCCMLICKYKP